MRGDGSVTYPLQGVRENRLKMRLVFFPECNIFPPVDGMTANPYPGINRVAQYTLGARQPPQSGRSAAERLQQDKIAIAIRHLARGDDRCREARAAVQRVGEQLAHAWMTPHSTSRYLQPRWRQFNRRRRQISSARGGSG